MLGNIVLDVLYDPSDQGRIPDLECVVSRVVSRFSFHLPNGTRSVNAH